MKNFLLSILTAIAFILTSTTAFAAIQEQITEGVDLTKIKRLAIAYPNHYKISNVSDEPNVDALIEMLGTTNKSEKFTVIPYADIAQVINKDKNIDITKLEKVEAEVVFYDNIANYADAYVTLTTANNNDPTIFIFKIQDAKTGDIMYILKINSRSFMKNARGYNSACELFYKTLDVAINKAAKK